MACPEVPQILVGPADAYEQNPLGYQKSRECLDATAETCFGSLVGVDGLMIRINDAWNSPCVARARRTIPDQRQYREPPGSSRLQ